MVSPLVKAVALAAAAQAFLLPGIAPHDYQPGERVWLKVNSLTSSKTQVPYEYYRFQFCKPRKVFSAKENFGEFLSGDRIHNSPYRIFTLEDTYCNVLCATTTAPKTSHKYKGLKHLIEHGYHHNWLVDSLPAAAVTDSEDGETTSYSRGVPVGYVDKDKDKIYVYNHVQLIVKYHETDNGARVVGIYAEPYSVRHKFAAGIQVPYSSQESKNAALGSDAVKTCTGYPMTRTDATFAGPQELIPGGQIIYTYDVVWEPSDVAWASRWDIYLNTGDETLNNVHWFSIVNAVIIVLTLGAILAVILVRSLRADLSRYNEEKQTLMEGGLEDVDESGWKVVHADVFRPPQYQGLLCACVASGAQLGVMALLVLGFAYVGFVSPANRGSLLMALLATYALVGGVAGYVQARLYKALGGQRWSATTAATSALFPCTCGVVYLGLDVALLAKKSSGAVPVLVFGQLVALFLFVVVPLTYLGAAAGFSKETIEWPARASKIERPIPPQPATLSLPVSALVCGVVPFGASFVELYFVLDSLWMEAYYYLFGFAACGFILLVLAAAEVASLLTYYTLCAENHRWWWRAFLAPATTGLYVFGYAAYYYGAHLQEEAFDALQAGLFFGYMLLVSLGVALVAGAAGFLASLKFLAYIFAQIKFD